MSKKKNLIILVRIGQKNPSLSITESVCHLSASRVMPNGESRDGYFYPTFSLVIDSFNLSDQDSGHTLWQDEDEMAHFIGLPLLLK